MPKIGGHRGGSSAPNISQVSKDSTPSSSSTTEAKKAEPQQETPQLSEQQKSQRKLDKRASGEMRQAVYRGKVGGGAHRAPASGGTAAPSISSSSSASGAAAPNISSSSTPKSDPKVQQQTSSKAQEHPPVAQQKRDKQFSGEMKQAIYRGQTKMGAHYKASPEVHKQMEQISRDVNGELKTLYAKYPTMSAEGKRVVPNIADKEKIALYENLSNSMKHPDKANAISHAISENKDHALYKHMGQTKFAAFVALSNTNLEKSKTSAHGMTTMERAALLGYTTGDYNSINPALRAGKGQISDPGLSAYAKEVKGALQKLPDYKSPTGSNTIYRSIFPDKDPTKNDWCKTAFVEKNTYSDFAFASTSMTPKGGGDWNLTIVGTKNAKNIAPYSAWPGEAEALIIPGTQYTVGKVSGRDVELIPQ